MGLVGLVRSGVTQFFHDLAGLARQVDLLGNAFVVHITLDITPALHLGEDPHAHGVPRERVEVDAVRHVFYLAKAIGVVAGQHLLNHRNRLVQIVLWRDGFGDFLTVIRIVGVLRRVDDGAQQGAVGVRVLGRELLAAGKGAARVAFPDVLGQHVDEAHLLPNSTLVERIR